MALPSSEPSVENFLRLLLPIAVPIPVVGILEGEGPALVRPTAEPQMITHSDVALTEEKGRGRHAPRQQVVALVPGEVSGQSLTTTHAWLRRLFLRL